MLSQNPRCISYSKAGSKRHLVVSGVPGSSSGWALLPKCPGCLLSPPFPSMFLFVKSEICSTSPKAFPLLGLAVCHWDSQLPLSPGERGKILRKSCGGSSGASLCWGLPLFPLPRTIFMPLLYLESSFILSDLEGNDNPPQCPCLENPIHRGAWWAAVHGVVKSDMSEQLNTQATLLS